ncbi:hypothetical protein [Rhizobium sp. 18065]|nr:hypothetical protein [Rhizobium sp. 18065]
MTGRIRTIILKPCAKLVQGARQHIVVREGGKLTRASFIRIGIAQWRRFL